MASRRTVVLVFLLPLLVCSQWGGGGGNNGGGGWGSNGGGGNGNGGGSSGGNGGGWGGTGGGDGGSGNWGGNSGGNGGGWGSNGGGGGSNSGGWGGNGNGGGNGGWNNGGGGGNGAGRGGGGGGGNNWGGNGGSRGGGGNGDGWGNGGGGGNNGGNWGGNGGGGGWNNGGGGGGTRGSCPVNRYAGLVTSQMLRFFNGVEGRESDHAFTTARNEQARQMLQSRGYHPEQHEDKLFVVYDDDFVRKHCPQLVALRRVILPTKNDNKLCLADDLGSCQQGGTANEIVGYVSRTYGYCGATMNVDEYYSALWQDTHYVWDDYQVQHLQQHAPHMRVQRRNYFYGWPQSATGNEAERQQLRGICE